MMWRDACGEGGRRRRETARDRTTPIRMSIDMFLRFVAYLPDRWKKGRSSHAHSTPPASLSDSAAILAAIAAALSSLLGFALPARFTLALPAALAGATAASLSVSPPSPPSPPPPSPPPPPPTSPLSPPPASASAVSAPPLSALAPSPPCLSLIAAFNALTLATQSALERPTAAAIACARRGHRDEEIRADSGRRRRSPSRHNSAPSS